MNIPLVDLNYQHEAIAEEVFDGFARVSKSGAFIQGPDVTLFEEAFARYSGAAHCVGVNCATASPSSAASSDRSAIPPSSARIHATTSYSSAWSRT